MAIIINRKEFSNIREQLRDEGKKVVLCHGVFDLVHPGHIQHFKEAKEIGDVLVVSVTASKYVRKGPGRPYFNDEMRLATLSAISYIDYVMISQSFTVDDIVECVKPDIYVKGQEYKHEENDITGNIGAEISLVRKYGGEIYYTNGDVFSSTKLINHAFPVFSNELRMFLKEFKSRCVFDDILTYINIAKEKNVIVIGDAILDEYIFCKVQGLMSKNNAYSARFIKKEEYAGGSVAIARHLSGFCKTVTLLSVIGSDCHSVEVIDSECRENIKFDLIMSSDFKTITKKRYVEPDDKRRELTKVFAINNISESMDLPESCRREFFERLRNVKLENYDAVFLCDYGHGLIDDDAMEYIQDKARKLILNCQTNSSNYGLNLIKKYRKADFFSLDEKELRLAFSEYKSDLLSLLKKLGHYFGGIGCLTKGSKGAAVVDNGNICEVPALVLDVVDTIGAGDAFYALAGLMTISGADAEKSAFMGNVAGALASNVVGNKSELDPIDVIKFTDTLLKR